MESYWMESGVRSKLAKSQSIGLDMLLEVDRICQKHEIEYFLDSGTLLGAIRHKGFIPWDDDVDVAMMRKDYEAFLDVCDHELDERYFLQTSKTDPYYPFAIARILYEEDETALCEDAAYRTGYALDIFAFDNASDNPIMQGARVFLIKLIQGMCKSRIKIDYSRYQRPWERIAVFLTSAIGRLFSVDLLMKLQRKIATLCESRNTAFKSCFAYEFSRLDRTFPSHVYEEVEYREFEGYMLPIPRGWHDSLTILYGDYMTPPPIEERVPTHM